MPDTLLHPATATTHAYCLEWVRGALYRAHHVHELTLVDFPVDDAALAPDHEARLLAFARRYDEHRAPDASEAVRWIDFPHAVFVGLADPEPHLPRDWSRAQLQHLRQRHIPTQRLGVPVADVDRAADADGAADNLPFRVDYAARLGTVEGAKIATVVGGASQTGPEANNVDLSRLRAHAAVNFLIQEGHVPAGAIERLSSPGSSAPLTDAAGEELGANRNVRLRLTYSEEVCLLWKRTDLGRELRAQLRGARELGKDSDRDVAFLLRTYLMGAQAFDYLAANKARVSAGALSDWPHPAVSPRTRLPMDAVFAYGKQDDDSPENAPVTPTMRNGAAQACYTTVTEALASGHVDHSPLPTWEATLREIGHDPGLAASLALRPVSEADYRRLADAVFAVTDEHVTEVRPNFYWFDRPAATRAEAICREVLGRTVAVDWLLMDHVE